MRSSFRLLQYIFHAAFSVTIILFANYSFSQTDAFVRHHTSKSFVFQGERLPFYIDISNPTNSELTLVNINIQFSALVDVRGLDDRCSKWTPEGKTAIVCILPRIKANSFYQIDYYIVGNIDIRPEFSSSITVSSREDNIAVNSQSTETIGFSDGDFSIEGQTLTISVARDILFDTDRDGVSDINENILGTDPEDPNSSSHQNALIDVTVLYSDTAREYHRDKLESEIQYLITATNQFYQRNNVNITLRLAALGQVEYSADKSSISSVFEDLTSETHASFQELSDIRLGTGADMILLVHPFTELSDTDLCGVSASGVNAVMGDFFREGFAGRLLSVIDTGPACRGRRDIAALLGGNMGLAVSREDSPDGGTFPFSAGYKIDDVFATKMPSSFVSTTPLSEFTSRLNRLSTPNSLCLGRPCGIDRNDLAKGANAVFSLNATAYVISDLTPEVLPRQPSIFETTTTIDLESSSSLSIIQTSNRTGAFVEDWINYSVEVSNTSTSSLNDLAIVFSNAHNSNLYRTDDSQCTVLTQANETLLISGDSTLEGHGELTCYVKNLQPGQAAGFTYALKISDSGIISGEGYFAQLVSVNRIPYLESIACLPVFQDILSAKSGSDVCSIFDPFISLEQEIQSEQIIKTEPKIDLKLLPSITGPLLTVPFIRTSDGLLLSAQFRVGLLEQLELELITVEFLESTLQPQIESIITINNRLIVKNLEIQGSLYDLEAQIEENSDPVTFFNVVLLKK
ncbi:MAG: hypothetical protein COA96_07635 [SAR86 cluster bacterium]|uniref:Uncharacterized protein n=1 Tax=SAR86 cluster bacterium TaxID=2030880 RepID=A0A2A5B196_9GAMM|nr:MAG: hypothetical protein COA96_07635 [SAR86 cluster bacterium]